MSDFQLVWRGKEVSAQAREAGASGLSKAAEVLLDTSHQRAPVDEGVLRGSGTVSVDLGSMTATVSYDTPYALVQHEDLTLNHPNGGEAKYLESALLEKRDELLRYVADKVSAALKA